MSSHTGDTASGGRQSVETSKQHSSSGEAHSKKRSQQSQSSGTIAIKTSEDSATAHVMVDGDSLCQHGLKHREEIDADNPPENGLCNQCNRMLNITEAVTVGAVLAALPDSLTVDPELTASNRLTVTYSTEQADE